MKWNSKRIIILILIVLLVVICVSGARKRRIPSRLKKVNRNAKLPKLKNQKQLLYETRETSPPSFVTLLFFRLIYGIATQMGLEERLPSFIAPPNADESDYGFFEAPSLFGGNDDYDLGI